MKRRRGRVFERAAYHRGADEFATRLASARGFRVDGPGGALGRLSRPRYGNGGSLEAIVVSSGVLRKRQLTVPYEHVEWILPRVRRVLLHTQTGTGMTRPEGGDQARA